MDFSPGVTLAIGLGIGLLLGLPGGAALIALLRRGRPGGDAEHARLTAALETAQAAAARSAGLAERLAAERESFDRELAATQRAADERLDLERDAHERQTAALRAEADRRTAEIRGALEQRIAELTTDPERLGREFEVVSRRVVAAGTEQLLSQAEERLRRSHEAGTAELAKREESVRRLVEPLGRALEQVRAEVGAAEAARLEAQGALVEQVRGMRDASDLLRTETAQLVTALRSSQVRGAWGELQLRRVVEAAGMLAHVDFVEQSQVGTDDGALRPDLVVRLAGGKNVVVDAKVAFLGYLEAQQANDPATRSDRLAAHARHFRRHVDDLAAKRYWDQFSPAPEFVVMFVPAEAFWSAALEQDATLLEYAVARNVVVATPMTLVALLRAVAYAWRQDALADNAQQVLTLGKQLHGRLAVMGSHLAALGGRLQDAATAYNRTVASLESRVLVSARRFADLHVVDDELASPGPADLRLRSLSAAELVASATDAVVDIDDIADGLTRGDAARA